VHAIGVPKLTIFQLSREWVLFRSEISIVRSIMREIHLPMKMKHDLDILMERMSKRVIKCYDILPMI
jgi:hypothetical protein